MDWYSSNKFSAVSLFHFLPFVTGYTFCLCCCFLIPCLVWSRAQIYIWVLQPYMCKAVWFTFSASLPLCMSFWLLTTPSPRRNVADKSKMMLKARSRRKASRCNAVLFISMACFCLQEARSEGSKLTLSTLQMVISNHVIDIWLINTIGNVHDASQCADSDNPGSYTDIPGNCCSHHVDDRQCRNGYKVSSVSFEECQKTDEGCSFFNGCFSCVLSPPGKDSPHPAPHAHEILRSSHEWENSPH